MKTNTNEVRRKIQKHIKEYYTKKELKEQIDYMICGNRKVSMLDSVNNAALELVRGGEFLIYNEDVKDFLNSLGINPQNKEYDDMKSWDLYCKLIAYNIEKIYNDKEVKK